DEEALQRIIDEIAGPGGQGVEYLIVLGEEPLEQLSREVVLVAKMVEEPALGDAGRFDQFLDGRGGEALVNDGIVGEVENPGARPLALGRRRVRELYRRSGFRQHPIDHASLSLRPRRRNVP